MLPTQRCTYVRQYKGTKYLSIGMDCQIENIDDIGDTIETGTSCKTKIDSQDGNTAERHNCGMMTTQLPKTLFSVTFD